MKKYEFTEETIDFMGHTLHRIKACRDFGSVKDGDIGGFIEKEENLSHDSDAWVSGEAKVYENAKVFGNARVFENARVSGDVWICEEAKIYEEAEVRGSAVIFGNALIFGNANISGEANVSGEARVFENARISANASVSKNALIIDSSDCFVVGPIGSRGDFTTFYKTTTGIAVSCGCFSGTIDEFENAVKETHGDNEHARAYNAAICLAKMIIKEGE